MSYPNVFSMYGFLWIPSFFIKILVHFSNPTGTWLLEHPPPPTPSLEKKPMSILYTRTYAMNRKYQVNGITYVKFVHGSTAPSLHDDSLLLTKMQIHTGREIKHQTSGRRQFVIQGHKGFFAALKRGYFYLAFSMCSYMENMYFRQLKHWDSIHLCPNWLTCNLCAFKVFYFNTIVQLHTKRKCGTVQVLITATWLKRG
jgi:hypothetical protein